MTCGACRHFFRHLPVNRLWFADKVPTYTFKNSKGEYVDREMSVDAVMDLPVDGNGRSYITEDGQRYHRSMSGGALGYGNVGLAYDWNEYPKISSALPKGCAGAEHVKEGRNKGKPIIESKKQERELLRMHGYTRDYSANDPQPSGGIPMPRAPWQGGKYDYD